MIKSERVSESVRLGMILALTGGFMDAYSYLVRGGAFANAETGNIVLMGIHMAKGNWGRVLYYLVPVVSFALGVYVAEYIRKQVGDNPKVHWKEGILWAEMVLIFIAGWIPQQHNALVNAMIAFICAMQVEAFRKIHGMAFATTMCTGNLRSGTELLSVSQFEHDPKKRRGGLHYFLIDGVFAGGAAVGAVVCKLFAEKSIWLCIAALFGAQLFIMHQKKNAEV